MFGLIVTGAPMQGKICSSAKKHYFTKLGDGELHADGFAAVRSSKPPFQDDSAMFGEDLITKEKWGDPDASRCSVLAVCPDNDQIL